MLKLNLEDNLINSLGRSGINKLLVLMVDAYKDLLKRGFVKEDSQENSITEEWAICIYSQWEKKSHSLPFKVIPLHQKEDASKGKKGKRFPTIDFCFRDRFFPEQYFGVECKLLDQGCKEHYRAYVSDGINRFLDGRYSSKCNVGSMVAYIRSGGATECICDISNYFSELPDGPVLTEYKLNNDFDFIFESNHMRTYGVSPFCLYHLFFPFFCLKKT